MRDAGVPSLLNWHFTDRYYHTNLDRPDKTSAAEMVNVGVAVATSAWFLASADERDADGGRRSAGGVGDARGWRSSRSRAQRSWRPPADRAKAEATEAAVLAAWRKWYGEALESVRRLPVKGSSPALDARIAQAQQRLAP